MINFTGRFKAIFLITMALSLGLTASATFALIETDQLSRPELSARYRQLIDEYRCPKCQNQNLAGSDSPISADLRREIRRMLEEGDSNEAISDYLVARYGDFILYRPRLQQGTYLLWWGPALLLITGLLVAGLFIKRQVTRAGESDLSGKQAPGDALSVKEQQKLDQLLNASPASEPSETTPPPGDKPSL